MTFATTTRATTTTARCATTRRAPTRRARGAFAAARASATRARATTKTMTTTRRLESPRVGKTTRTRATPADDEGDVPFGYTRADVMLIGTGVTGAGFAAYYGLQSFAGMDSTKAGNAVQLTFVLGLTLAWVGSYVMRVFNKDMTYAKQLKDVRAKRTRRERETKREGERKREPKTDAQTFRFDDG